MRNCALDYTEECVEYLDVHSDKMAATKRSTPFLSSSALKFDIFFL